MGFKLKINKVQKGFKIRGEVLQKYFYGSDVSNISQLHIVISPYNSSKGKRSFRERSKIGKRFEILTKKTLASANGLNLSIRNWNFNEIWFREIETDLGFDLLKNAFFIDIEWEIYSNSKFYRFSLTLKSPTPSPKI